MTLVDFVVPPAPHTFPFRSIPSKAGVGNHIYLWPKWLAGGSNEMKPAKQSFGNRGIWLHVPPGFI
jgi:hypothetical protein